jgi:hypothetical protein
MERLDDISDRQSNYTLLYYCIYTKRLESMGGNGWTGPSDESLKIPDPVFVTVGDVLTVLSILASEVCVLDVLHAT